MKIFKIIICLIIMVGIACFIDSQTAASGFIMSMAIIGGPFRDMKYAGETLRPTKDGEAEWKSSGTEWETELSPNGDDYATGESVVGYVQQECAFTPEEFSAMEVLKDSGATRSGTATAPDGSVLSFNGRIEGELTLANGKATVKIAGKVRLQ